MCGWSALEDVAGAGSGDWRLTAASEPAATVAKPIVVSAVSGRRFAASERGFSAEDAAFASTASVGLSVVDTDGGAAVLGSPSIIVSVDSAFDGEASCHVLTCVLRVGETEECDRPVEGREMGFLREVNLRTTPACVWHHF